MINFMNKQLSLFNKNQEIEILVKNMVTKRKAQGQMPSEVLKEWQYEIDLWPYEPRWEDVEFAYALILHEKYGKKISEGGDA